MLFKEELGKKERLIIEFEDGDPDDLKRIATSDFNFLKSLIGKLQK